MRLWNNIELFFRISKMLLDAFGRNDETKLLNTQLSWAEYSLSIIATLHISFSILLAYVATSVDKNKRHVHTLQVYSTQTSNHGLCKHFAPFLPKQYFPTSKKKANSVQRFSWASELSTCVRVEEIHTSHHVYFTGSKLKM